MPHLSLMSQPSCGQLRYYSHYLNSMCCGTGQDQCFLCAGSISPAAHFLNSCFNIWKFTTRDFHLSLLRVIMGPWPFENLKGATASGTEATGRDQRNSNIKSKFQVMGLRYYRCPCWPSERCTAEPFGHVLDWIDFTSSHSSSHHFIIINAVRRHDL